MKVISNKNFLRLLGILFLCTSTNVESSEKQPNIVVIWGDDIGQSNLSAYTKGLMGYYTPNIDRIANEGVIFTDYYAEQSCTAGRAAFITGQSVARTGLSKIGFPGADLGIRAEDPTIAELLKLQDYATGQFGKNHLGDKDKHLPTAHGFDEFYGNLYHLNVEEEPEYPDYPSEEDFPNFRKKYGPRGVIHSFANADGTQTIEDTGPLTSKRMETIDDDIAERAAEFIEKKHLEGRPFFVWVNFTHMHFRTHPKPESVGQAGRWLGPYADVMIDHDKNVGTILEKLDELGLTNDTIVFYSTDNGPHINSWPDAGMAPFRNEKNSNWEGAYRVPAMVRWPDKIVPGTISNTIMSHLDWLPTILAAAGVPDIKEQLLSGVMVGDKHFKVHLDGYNFVPYLSGEVPKGPRNEFFYFSDDCELTGLRYDNWKFVFAEQRVPGTMSIWFEPYTKLRIPKLFNLRLDPYERADITSNTYYDYVISHSFLLVPLGEYVGNFMKTFITFPPRQRATSYSFEKIFEAINEPLEN